MPSSNNPACRSPRASSGVSRLPLVTSSTASPRRESASTISTIRGCSRGSPKACRSEEHTSEFQSLRHLECGLLLEKKNKTYRNAHTHTTDLTHTRLKSRHLAI